MFIRVATTTTKDGKKYSYPVPQDAIKATETIGIACLNIGGQKHRIISRGGKDARRVFIRP